MLLIAITMLLPVGLAVAGTLVAAGGVLWYTRRQKPAIKEPPTRKLPPGPKPKPDVPKPKPGPDEPPELPDVAKIVDQYAGRFNDAAFQQIETGESQSGTVRKVLNAISPGAGNKPAMDRAVKQLMNEGRHNDMLYSAPSTDMDAIDGLAVTGAWMPRHEDAIATMRIGYVPQRNIDAQGKRAGSATSYGAPWIPALNHAAVAQGVTDKGLLLAADWEDGTSAMEPPPHLLEALQTR